jgi:hypothetical protein
MRIQMEIVYCAEKYETALMDIPMGRTFMYDGYHYIRINIAENKGDAIVDAVSLATGRYYQFASNLLVHETNSSVTIWRSK